MGGDTSTFYEKSNKINSKEKFIKTGETIDKSLVFLVGLLEVEGKSDIAFRMAGHMGSTALPMAANVLNESVKTEYVNAEEKQNIIYICNKYSGILYLELDCLTATDVVTHKINTSGLTKAINIRPY
ncbi:hypothetical protein QTP88_010676 [Uroleucon formosanum]